MPEFILPAEADHCPYCNAVLRDPPNCCEKMVQEHEAECLEQLSDPGMHYDYADYPPEIEDGRTPGASAIEPPAPAEALSEERMAEIAAREQKARDMVVTLCKPRGSAEAREWTMSIPARPDRDPDLVIAAALDCIPDLLREVARLKEEALAKEEPPTRDDLLAWQADAIEAQSVLREPFAPDGLTPHTTTSLARRAVKMIRSLQADVNNLLAVIHGDGGHHTGEVGFERSLVDARATVVRLLSVSDDLAAAQQREQALREDRDALGRLVTEAEQAMTAYGCGCFAANPRLCAECTKRCGQVARKIVEFTKGAEYPALAIAGTATGE